MARRIRYIYIIQVAIPHNHCILIICNAHTQVQSSCLFNLLLSLETPSPDPLNIAELVKEPKPLKAIDFCYHDEDEMVTVLDCITLCVMVVSYSAESTRGYQMLVSAYQTYKTQYGQVPTGWGRSLKFGFDIRGVSQ